MDSLAKLKPMITRKRMVMPRVGTRKLYAMLKDDIKQSGIKIGRDGLFSYLRWENMLIKRVKNYTITTNSNHWLRKYPNLYLGCKLTRPEQVFVSDITYVKSKERTHYLSLVTDAYSRKIMGYELSDDMSSEHIVKALNMAVKNRKTSLPLIHHSDRGLQYCSMIYQKALSKAFRWNSPNVISSASGASPNGITANSLSACVTASFAVRDQAVVPLVGI